MREADRNRERLSPLTCKLVKESVRVSNGYIRLDLPRRLPLQ